ncbi:MAG: cysteine desulfurase family protein [Verrucomicrobiales bacterium]|nr:cysteine desulfurase family protein [Verrucomicrobiales bacterium]
MIYFDNNATTQIDPEVADGMEPWIREQYGNPSAGYRFGKKARAAIGEAREKVAALIDADPEEIIFTSGGTESNNTAITSAIRIWPDRKNLISSSVEHSAIYEPLSFYDSTGYSRRLNRVQSDGKPDLDEWRTLLAENSAAFCSMIWANNETGVISPIVEAAEIANEAGVYFHSDAVQAVGKIPVSVNAAPIHSLAISAHKFHGPKGVGALYVNRHTRFKPLLFGGGQENEKRSGTENVPGIVGMGIAAQLALSRLADAKKMASLRDDFETKVIAAVEGIEVNGHRTDRLPNTTNLYFPGVDGEGLLILLDEAGLCCSPGSACSTGSVQPSRILKAMGCSAARARSSVRFSLSHSSTQAEVDAAVELIQTAVGKLRITMPSGGGVKINTGS